MAMYKHILFGKKSFCPDWQLVLNNINKSNIIIRDFNNFDEFKKTILNKNISYVLPLSQGDYNSALSHIKKMNSNIKVLYPTNQTRELLRNKNKFTEFMLKNYIEYIPDIYYLNNIKLKDIEYPAISKPVYSTNGSNMTIIYNNNDLLKLKEYNNIQKFIDNQYEYSAFILCIDGRIITQKIIRFKYEKYTIKKQNFPKEYENVDNFNTEVFKNIINKLCYSGGINFDFKFDEINNKLYIFEINPRFGGSAFTNNFIYELLCVNE